MTLRRSWPIDKGLPNAIDIRSINRYQWPTPGIIPVSEFDYANFASRSLLSAGTGWGTNIAAFEGVLRRPDSIDGTAFVTNDATVNNAVTSSSAPASGTRIDTVYVWAPDPTKGDTLTQVAGEVDAQGNPRPRAVPVFGILPGTSANGGLGANPTKPDLGTYGPSGAVELGTVRIPSTATSLTSSGVVFTATFPYALPAGLPRIARTTAERDSLITAPAAEQLCYVGNRGTVYRYTGSAWMLWAMAPINAGATNGGSGQSLVNWGTSGGVSKLETSVANGIATVHFRARFSGTGMSWGDILYRLAVTPEALALTQPYGAGTCMVNDSDAGLYMVPFIIISDTNGNPCVRIGRVGVDNGATATWASSQPFNPAVGDTFSGSFSYPVATSGN